MAETILPRVRLIFACEEAALDPTDLTWIVKHPITTLLLPDGTAFPFRLPNLWIYAHLDGGLCKVELAVEFLRVLDDGSEQSIGVGSAATLDFAPSASRLLAIETAFGFLDVPFREEGRYVFRFVAAGDRRPLKGQRAKLTILDPSGRL